MHFHLYVLLLASLIIFWGPHFTISRIFQLVRWYSFFHHREDYLMMAFGYSPLFLKFSPLSEVQVLQHLEFNYMKQTDRKWFSMGPYLCFPEILVHEVRYFSVNFAEAHSDKEVNQVFSFNFLQRLAQRLLRTNLH